IHFRAPRHIYLAEQYHSLAFAVLQEGAVLEVVAPVHNRQEIAPRRLLDKHGSDVAPATTPPSPRHVDAAPLNRWAVTRSQRVSEARRQDRRLAAPVMQVVHIEPSQ